jgi:uncharacterized membrane protein YqjE
MDAASYARADRERSMALLASIRRLGAALWEQAGIRLELLTLELAEERARLIGVLFAIAAIVICAALAIAFGGLAALIAAWETPYRVAVALGFAAAFALVALGAGLLVRYLIGKSSPLFRHSIVEWRRDVAGPAQQIGPET